MPKPQGTTAMVIIAFCSGAMGLYMVTRVNQDIIIELTELLLLNLAMLLGSLVALFRMGWIGPR